MWKPGEVQRTQNLCVRVDFSGTYGYHTHGANTQTHMKKQQHMEQTVLLRWVTLLTCFPLIPTMGAVSEADSNFVHVERPGPGQV